MKVYKDGIYKTIKSEEFGVYLKQGFIKVIDELEPIDESKKTEVNIEEEPVENIETEKEVESEIVVEIEPEIQPTIEEEPVAPKSRRRKGG